MKPEGDWAALIKELQMDIDRLGSRVRFALVLRSRELIRERRISDGTTGSSRIMARRRGTRSSRGMSSISVSRVCEGRDAKS